MNRRDSGHWESTNVVINSRRSFVFGAGAVVLGGGLLAAYATDGFGLVPKEFEATPVYVESDVAIRGYDPVAYFVDKEPKPGNEEYQHIWNGATWQFSSAENRDAFVADPEAYAPQYGGFCAWAIAAKGKLYSTQPSNWKIVENKLYLNYSDGVQRKWEKDIPGFIVEGDKRWPQISGIS